MYINQSGDIKVRVRGVDQAIRDLARHSQEDKIAAQLGTYKAAQYLREKIMSKFGHYQSTGGDGNGPWARLGYETNAKKLRKYGFTGKPLIASGEMQNSFNLRRSKDKNAIATSVVSDDPKLIHHIFGAPRAHVPRRDPFLVTADEERDKCHELIIDEIWRAFDKG